MEQHTDAPTPPPPTTTTSGSNKTEEYSSRDPHVDALFLERLEAFMDRCLADIKAFSERELRPFEETRRCVAEWHAKHLFQALPPNPTENAGRRDYVRSVLIQSSRVLESLAETAGVQTFLLAVDLRDETDAGFLGGSLHGREFWRALRGGGEYGAKSFRQYCQKRFPSSSSAEEVLASSESIPKPAAQATQNTSNKRDAKAVKTDLYETVRRQLKAASGVRNAEMRWTNPERLDVYGVRLVGWPAGIPAQNPSSLRVNQNRQLLEAFESGTARFERLPTSTHPVPMQQPKVEVDQPDDSDDFSWAYDPEATPKISHSTTTTSFTTTAVKTAESGLGSPSPTPTQQAPTSLASNSRGNTPLSHTGSPLDPWDVYDSTLALGDEMWDEGSFRPRKRPRSEGSSQEAYSLDSGYDDP